MSYLNDEIENELSNLKARLVRFVDISHLDEVQSRGFPNAVVFALPLTAKYIKEVFNTPNYVQDRINDNYNFDDDEYSLTEHRAGELSDKIVEYIVEKGYKAFSQSDENLINEGKFDVEHKQSLLPHKTIALLGGLGWIGKNNLLITYEYGVAQCLGTVLTDAPLKTILHAPIIPKCGNCSVCVNICEQHVLKNKKWSLSTSRDEIVDVYRCTTCLKCLIHCPWTHRHMDRRSKK